MIRAEGDLGDSDFKLCPLVTPPPLEALLAKGQGHLCPVSRWPSREVGVTVAPPLFSVAVSW